MNKHRITIATLLLTLLSSATTFAEESTLKESAKQVGQEIGEGTREAGKKVAATAREVGHATRDAAKEVGKKVADTAVEVGQATRDGAKQFGKAVKGQTSSKASSTPAHQHKAN